jgi:hypothetical protein
MCFTDIWDIYVICLYLGHLVWRGSASEEEEDLYYDHDVMFIPPIHSFDTLARKLSKQWDINNPNRHGAVRCWIFNRLTFEIIRASSACLRGYRRNDYAPMVYYDFLFWRPSMNV